MKRSILIGVLLLPLFALGQKVELGADGGMNRVYDIKEHATAGSVDGVGFSCGLHTAYNINRHWQLGVGFQADQVLISYYNAREWAPYYLAPAEGKSRVNYTPYVFANGKIYVGKSYVFGGLKAGAIFANDREVISNYYGDGAKRGLGIMVGGQLGYNIYISRRISITTVVSPEYFYTSYQKSQGGPARVGLLLNTFSGVKYVF